MTGLLLDTRLKPLQYEYAETIKTSAENLMSIVNDVLDFSKIEAGKLAFEMMDFDLLPMLESTIDMLAERAQAKKVVLGSSVGQDVPVRLRTDPGRLRQVLVNLISNGIKSTHGGKVTVSINKETETDTKVVLRFRVQDSGIGIPADVQSRLFQAFTQADASTSRRYGGTGLGLAISKQLVAMMGGQIGVQSEPGRGSTFWFTGEFEKVAPGTRSEKPSDHDCINLRVLIVDASDTQRRILRHQFFSWKLRSSSAASSGEALEMLRAAAAGGAAYDVALVDRTLPEMDAFALARAIKADPAIERTRLVLLSEVELPTNGDELNAQGVAAQLAKPIKQSQLFDCLVSVIGKSAAESAFSSSNAQGRRVIGPAQHAELLKAKNSSWRETIS